MNWARFYTHLLIVFAIVSAGVSPACAFISGGKSFIEICGADGSVQTVEVDGVMDPFADQEPVPLQDHLKSLEKCPFCFVSHNYQYGQTESFVLSFDLPSSYVLLSAGLAVPHSLDVSGFEARGPPVFS